MKKEEFLFELKNGLLNKLESYEVDSIVNDYKEIFDEGSVLGKSDDDITTEIGSPSMIVKNVMEDIDNSKQDSKKAQNFCIPHSALAPIKSQILAYMFDWLLIPIALFIVVFLVKYLFTYPNLINIRFVDILLFCATCLFPPSIIISFIYDYSHGLLSKEVLMYDSLWPSIASQKYWSIIITFSIIIITRIVLSSLGKVTIGEKLTSIKAVRTDAKPLTLGNIIIREVIGFIATSIVTPITSLIMLSLKHQSISDFLADTIMIKTSKKGVRK